MKFAIGTSQRTCRMHSQQFARNCRLSLFVTSALALVSLQPPTASAASVVFDTTPYWSPVDAIIGGWGPGTSSTLRETFVAPMGASVTLNDFSFYAQSYYPLGSVASLYLQAFVYEWSGSMTDYGGGAVGSPLYLSSNFQFSPPPRSGGWVPLTANIGGNGLTLTPGDNYVMDFTLSDPTGYAESQGDIEFQEVPARNSNYPPLPAGVDGNGGVVWLNNGNDFAAINTTVWSTWGDTGDFAFKADFTLVPEPTAAMMMALGAVLWLWRRAKERKKCANINEAVLLQSPNKSTSRSAAVPELWTLGGMTYVGSPTT